MFRLPRRSVLVASAVMAALGCWSANAQSDNQAVKHVFVIALENHNWTQPTTVSGGIQAIYQNANAPFINSLVHGNAMAYINGQLVNISSQVSYATEYHNVLATESGSNPHIHPSEPNYIWAEAGTNFGIANDADPYPNNIVSAPSFRGLLQNAGISWKSYQEDIDLAKDGQGNLTNAVLPQNQWTVPLTRFSGTSPSYMNPYNGSNQYDFAPKHEGSLFFTATNGGNDPTPSNPEAKYYAPLQQLQTDLANNTVAKFNFITPNQFNDQHTPLANGFSYRGVQYTGDAAAIAQGDNFLSIIVPQIMASQAYKNNGAIVIWNDETEGGDDFAHTSTEIVISPLAKGNAYNSMFNYTHSSDLKTWQLVYGVYGPGGTFLGDAGAANTRDLSDLFRPAAIPAVPEPSPLIPCVLGSIGFAIVTRLQRAR